jgi:hypothetical protein
VVWRHARRWAAWFGGAVLLGAIAFGAGAAGMLGRPPSAPPGIVGAVASGVQAYDCPEGEPVGLFAPDYVVWLTARTADGEWFAVRDPALSYETVWIRSSGVSVEASALLPIDACITPPVVTQP